MKPPKNIHVFVLIDALGWTLVSDGTFLAEALPYRQPLRTLLGFSSGVIPSILTGLSPAQSGIWNLVYYDPDGSPFRALRHFSFVPDWLLDNRVGRRLMTELGRRILGLGRGFDCCVPPQVLPWFNWAERENIYQAGGLGTTHSIFDQLSQAGIPYRVYSYKQAMSDAQILRRAESDVERDEARFFFVYLCELDMFQHTHCNQPAKIAEKLAWYEQALGRLFTAARQRDPEARLFVFSDHGMTPVRHHYDLAAAVADCGLRMPQDYLAVYDSTMARFWFFSEQARATILERLRQVPCGRLLPDGELQELGVFFSDRRYGEAILLMDPGCLIAASGFNGNGWKPSGMHGYHPDDAHSDAVFLANCKPEIPPATVQDIYRYMREAVS
jgi:predicted AlkP superfamily pyrophosphatase or phosphodiesterase